MSRDTPASFKGILCSIAAFLKRSDYQFVTISPHSHSIYLSKRGNAPAGHLRDIFGWSLPFDPDQIDRELLGYLTQGNLLIQENGLARSRVRCSTAHSQMYFHSSYPTEQTDSVFFGPDTYRFLNFLSTNAGPGLGRIVDIGCGSGAGGVFCRKWGTSVTLTDINPLALSYAEANASINEPLSISTPVEFLLSDLFTRLTGHFDTVIANPPFIIDPLERTYRHGGEHFGTALSFKIAERSFERLAPKGRLFLYTAAPQIQGVDIFKAAIERHFHGQSCEFSYYEIDPDIFGEELRSPAYAPVERLAAVGLIVVKK